MVYIYKLYFEHEPNVCYIGKTSDLTKRMKVHRYDASTGKKYLVSEWIAKNGVKNLKFEILLQGENICENEERKQIEIHKKLGYELKNKNNGGFGRKNRAIAKFDLSGNLIEKFDTIKRAAESVTTCETKTVVALISRVCSLIYNKKTAYGFIWKYLD